MLPLRHCCSGEVAETSEPWISHTRAVPSQSVVAENGVLMPLVCVECVTSIIPTTGMMRNAGPVTACPCCGGREFEEEEEYDFLMNSISRVIRAGYTLALSPQGSTIRLRLESPNRYVTASFPLDAFTPGVDGRVEFAGTIGAMVSHMQGES